MSEITVKEIMDQQYSKIEELQQQLAQAIKQRDLAVEKLNKITEMTKESAYPNETLVAIRVVSMNTLKRINKLGEWE